jgi:hypothetical protein
MLGRIIQQGEWIIAYDGFESKIALRRFSGEARRGSNTDLTNVRKEVGRNYFSNSTRIAVKYEHTRVREKE